ncbi:MAG: hypothetical protein QM704_26795 [Anaeromyxobacteraceae bacterium]
MLTATLLALTTLAEPKLPPKPTTAATAAPSTTSTSKPAASGEAQPATAAPAKPAPATPAAAPPPAVAVPVADPGYPEWGTAIDAGIPGGVNLDVIYRPIPFIRLWAGPAWNYAAFGFQGGAGVALANWGITPVLSVEAGRYFSTDVAQFVKGGGSVPDEMKPLLQKISLNYAAALLGFEFGSPRGFSFALRLGLARMSLATHGSGTFTQDNGQGGTTSVKFTDPRFTATAPALKLGFQYWF